jgi:hypothetical protein
MGFSIKSESVWFSEEIILLTVDFAFAISAASWRSITQKQVRQPPQSMEPA